MIKHTTQKNETLDSLCFRYHGNASNIEVVLSDNPHLANYPAHLPAGVIISFEEITVAEPEKKPIALWS